MPWDKSLVFLKEYIQIRTSTYTIKKVNVIHANYSERKNESERELYY